MNPTEGAPAGGADAGSLRDEEESKPRSFEAECAPPGDDASRAANAVAYVGGALVLLGLLALALTWSLELWDTVTLLGIVGAVAAVLSWATRRLRPPAVSDVLAGVAAMALILCFDTVLDASDVVVGPAERWVLLCAPLMVLGGAFSWWFRSRAAGAWAVVGWVLLPLALVTGSEERLGFTLPLSVTVSEVSVWVALALMVVAATLVEQAARFAARRGRVDPSTVSWTTFVSSTTLGIVLVIAASVQHQSWFYFVLVALSAAVTGVAVWQREWIWLSTASRLFTAAAVTALGGIDSGPGRAMGLVVLSYSFFTFTPLRRRLPDRLSVRLWEGMIWLMGLCTSCAFAFAPGAWPAAGGLWAVAVIAIAATRRRALAMVLAALALFVVFIVRVIDMFGATVGAGFGTIAFGVAILVVVVIWRQGVRSASSRLKPLNLARFRLR